MDKKMNRQIGWRPEVSNTKKSDKPKTDSKAKSAAPPKNELSGQERSKKVYDWLCEHSLFNLNGLCKRVETDRGNFMKAMGADKELKNELLEKIVAELKLYGYAE